MHKLSYIGFSAGLLCQAYSLQAFDPTPHQLQMLLAKPVDHLDLLTLPAFSKKCPTDFLTDLQPSAIASHRSWTVYPLRRDDVFDRMAQSITGDMSASIIQQTEEGTREEEIVIDPVLYPRLAALYASVKYRCCLTGTLPKRLMEDLESFIISRENRIKVLLREGKETEANRQGTDLQFWFAWLVVTEMVYALKHLYNKAENRHMDYAEANLALTRSFNTREAINRLRHLLMRFNSNLREREALLIGAEFLTLDTDSGEGYSATVLDLPVLLLTSLLINNRALLNTLTHRNVIHFNHASMYERIPSFRRSYPLLVHALSDILKNVYPDTPSLKAQSTRSKTAAAVLYVLKHESLFLTHCSMDSAGSHHQNEPAYSETGSEDQNSSAGATAQTVHQPAISVTISDNLLQQLNRYAELPENQQAMAMVVLSLLHMPSLIPVIDHITSQRHIHLANILALLHWLADHHGRLLDETAYAYQRPIIQAALVSLSEPNRYSTTENPEIPQALVQIVETWVNRVQIPYAPPARGASASAAGAAANSMSEMFNSLTLGYFSSSPETTEPPPPNAASDTTSATPSENTSDTVTLNARSVLAALQQIYPRLINDIQAAFISSNASTGQEQEAVIRDILEEYAHSRFKLL